VIQRSSLLSGAGRSLRALAGEADHSRLRRLLRRWEWALIGVILLIAGLAHGINMFDFPYQENDEGTYMSQAWAVTELGELAPYTYWYDHAPLGWIQIAGWTISTGGIYAFGTAVDSGRVLMLVVQVVSTFALYRVARNISGSVAAATLTSLTFALSAYGIYYHRRVLLDNIATLWMLLSILPLVSGRLTLSRVWISAFALGVSILSKEVTLFVAPTLAYLVFYRADKEHRRFAAFGWSAIVGCIFSTYFLMAALKGELFPPGTLLGGTSEHVSLIGTLRYQASRGEGGGLFDPDSLFWENAYAWSRAEPLLVVGGSVAALISVVLMRRHRLVGIMGLATLSLWAFLAKGGEVIEFYLVPLLPLLALNLGLVLGILANAIRSAFRRYPSVGAVIARGILLAALGVFFALLATRVAELGPQDEPYELWNGREALAQRQAIEWVRANLPTDSVIMIDNYAYTALHDPPGGAKEFDGAHYYFKVQSDPEVRDDVLGGDWRNVDYILATNTMKDHAYNQNLGLVREALDHSTPIASFDTGGYPVEIRRVNDTQQLPAPTDPLLANTWESYEDRFIEGGRVDVDPYVNQQTTSEGQAYAMLRAVYMDDREAFDEVWRWTKENLQVRGDDLLAWRWGERPDGTTGVLDEGSATDADTDAALALLFAAKRWEAPEYEREALRILDGIWGEETVLVGGERVVVAGDWARGEESSWAVVNPSYFAPYAYKIFAEADPGHPWEELVHSSYNVFGRIRASSELGGEAGLAPNWLVLNTESGELLPADDLGPGASEFSYDASRIPWRISLDYLWFEDDRARETLKSLYLPRRELEDSGRLFAAYDPNGRPTVDYEVLSMYAGVVPGLLVGGGEKLECRVFAEKIMIWYRNGPEGAYWGDPDNYYAQNMAWFATAVIDGSMSDIWAEQETIDWQEATR
jgi:endo-1,4-beta-D-glucanase Y